MLQPLAIVIALGLAEPDRDHLRGVIPLVDRGRDVEPLVALQPDQLAAERLGQHLGDLGLADAGLAFQKQRPAHPERQKQHGRQRAVGDIMAGGEKLQRVVDGRRDGAWCGVWSMSNLGNVSPLIPAKAGIQLLGSGSPPSRGRTAAMRYGQLARHSVQPTYRRDFPPPKREETAMSETPANPIDPGVRIGHVHLKVADIERALPFYRDVLGFEETYRRPGAVFMSAGGYHHHIALNTWESRGGQPPAPGSDRPLPHRDPVSDPPASGRRAAAADRGRHPARRRQRPRGQRGAVSARFRR